MTTADEALIPISKLDRQALLLWLERLAIGLILLLAIVTRFYNLGARVMSHDEVNHVMPSYDFYQGRGYAYNPVTHGPLQFHLIALSYFLLGDSDFTARIPAALFSVATVAIGLLGFRRYLGRAGALIAGLLFLISPFMLFYGRYARNEAFIVVWGLLALFAILRYLDTGERWILFVFTAANAFHFVDKATAYIFAAEQLLFLLGLLLWRLRLIPWKRPRLRLAFFGLLAVAGLGAALAGTGLLAPAGKWLLVAGLVLAGVSAAAGLLVLWYGFGWAALRQERAFDLLILLGTLILPLLAAIPLRLAGLDPSNPVGAGLNALLALGPLAALAAILGCWWRPRQWWQYALLFYAIFTVFYTTFFTNPTGLAGGLLSALGYWMTQQPVERGSQPWYYYAFIQIPVYEFLPALGTCLALLISNRDAHSQVIPDSLAEENKEVELLAEDAVAQTALQPPATPAVPARALFLYWFLSSLIAFTIAGEKMPWLTIHIALPLILAAAWGLGRLVTRVDWGPFFRRGVWLVVFLLPIGVTALAVSWQDALLLINQSPFWPDALGGVLIAAPVFVGCLVGCGLLFRCMPAGNTMRVLVLAGFAFLAVLTGRAAVRAAYVNYDLPLEYLVYAHAAPDPKQFLLPKIEEISRRTTGGLDVTIAYDKRARYPFWWYLRHYPNRRDFGENPTQDLSQVAIILAGEQSYDQLASIVGENYVTINAERLWWPNQDYYRIKWDEIAASQGIEPAALTQPEYLRLAWTHLTPFFTDPAVCNAVWAIWLNRNYGPYARLQNSTTMTLATWQPADRMRMYVRKDIAAQVWGDLSEK